MSTSTPFSAGTNKYAYAQAFSRTSSARPTSDFGPRHAVSVWRRLAVKRSR